LPVVIQIIYTFVVYRIINLMQKYKINNKYGDRK